MNRALWGEVFLRLRRVLVRRNEDLISICFIVDGATTDDDKSSMSYVATQVIADFPDCRIEELVVRVDYPTPVEEMDDWYLVFSRREYYP
ncbi:hypothetical protein ACWDYH_37855 [Nocardia goodfellowii]